MIRTYRNVNAYSGILKPQGLKLNQRNRAYWKQGAGMVRSPPLHLVFDNFLLYGFLTGISFRVFDPLLVPMSMMYAIRMRTFVDVMFGGAMRLAVLSPCPISVILLHNLSSIAAWRD